MASNTRGILETLAAKQADAALDSFDVEPNCPKCGKSNRVNRTVSSFFKAKGSHFCDICGVFTPTPTTVQASAPITQQSDASFQAEFERRFPSISYEFVQLMDDIGKVGREKYGDKCIELRAKRGDYTRTDRVLAREIAKHSANHFSEYIDGVTHDVYGTRRHQLAAASFNPMMEFLLSKGDK